MHGVTHGPRSGVTIPWLKYVICSRYRKFIYGTGQVIRSVTRLSDGHPEVYCQPTFAPPEERPSIILRLLVDYNTKPIGAGLGCDRVVSKHELYRTHESI
ncbi:hypothetical protein CsSME_00053534 [Camellia sinensis var. sinensis]